MAISFFERRAQRAAMVRRYGSPEYLHVFGELTTGASEYVEIATTFPAAQKYAPLNNLVLTNNSNQFVTLFVNGAALFRVPGGVITSVSDTAVWSFRVVNSDTGTAAAGEIRANLSIPPMGADEAARLEYPAMVRRGY